MNKEKLIKYINDILHTQKENCISIDEVLNNCTVEKQYLKFIKDNKNNIFIDNFNIYTFDYSINNDFLNTINLEF